MKQKLKIGLLLWSLIMLLGAIGLGGCDKDDDFSKGIYQGYVMNMDQDHGYFTIKITNSPYNVSKMPVIDDIIEVWEYPSNMDFEVQQELSFKIISAERLLLILTNFDDVKWKCNILILNQD